ncbi:MAG: choice-of-anchor L domain-containing protein [Flavobacteriales bacterium]|nr:choice-of-anchor L domain-containing protein [Flavobacteriales bacterium]
MKHLVVIFILSVTALGMTAQCTNYTIDAGGGTWDSEISWQLYNEDGVLVASDIAVVGYTVCLPAGCYSLNLLDSFGDGWNGANWVLYESGVAVATETMLNGTAETFQVSIGGAVCGGPGPCAEPFTFSAFGGTFDGEISWNLSDGAGNLVQSGFATTGVDLCLEADCYLLELYDSFGDSWNGATWALIDFAGNTIGTGTLATGGYGYVQVPIGGAACDPMNTDVISVESGSYTADQLITDVFLGDCLEATNVTYTGDAGAIGTFSNGSAIGIEEGIIITSGSVFNAPGPNTSGSAGTATGAGGSLLLDNISGVFTYDASVFTFEFTASTSQVTFTYVFASEEYPEFVCSGLNDVFGFFVSGPGYADNTNIAIVPGTSDPVTINNVNNNGGLCLPYYPAYYNDNAGSAIQYDGYTEPMEAVINTVPCQTYTITIAVADGGDSIYDSAVFLQAESFSAGVDVAAAAVAPGGGQSTSGTCEDYGSFLLVNNGDPFEEEVTVTFNFSGSAVAGVDYEDLVTSVTFQPGESWQTIDVTGILDQLDGIPETLTMQLDNVCSCTVPEPVTLYLCSSILLAVEWLEFEVIPEDDGRVAKCYWETISERNNSHFIVERSTDGNHWEAIGQVAGNEDSYDLLHYEFRDENPLIGLSYYRIKQFDFDGQWDVTETRAHFFKPDATSVVYPNPTTTGFYASGWNGEIKAVSLDGKVFSLTRNAESAYLTDHLTEGMYILQFIIEDEVFWRERLVVR